MSGPRASSRLTVDRGRPFTDCSSTGTDRHGTAWRTPTPNTLTTLPLPPLGASGVRDLPFLRVIPAVANRLWSKRAREFCPLRRLPAQLQNRRSPPSSSTVYIPARRTFGFATEAPPSCSQVPAQ